MDDDATLTIGEVARRAGLNPSAIRFYESEGLLPRPQRAGGQRRYGEGVVHRLALIAVAKQAGFALHEIRVLLDGVDGAGSVDERLRALAARKLPEVDELIARARAMREWLSLAAECRCPSLEQCELFAAPPSQVHTPPGGRGRRGRVGDP